MDYRHFIDSTYPASWCGRSIREELECQCKMVDQDMDLLREAKGGKRRKLSVGRNSRIVLSVTKV